MKNGRASLITEDARARPDGRQRACTAHDQAELVPGALGEMMSDPDTAKAKRAADAMMRMVKLDIAQLKAAFEGTSH
jgi:hypothetical protein